MFKPLKVCAINPQWYDEVFMSVPLGLATIVAIVKDIGHDVEVIDFDAERSKDVQARLSEYGGTPDVALISGMITNYRRIQSMTNDIRRVWSQARIVMGGSLATTASDTILNTLNVDIFVMGEGDVKIGLVLSAISDNAGFESIPGIKYKKDGKIASNPDTLPPPDITNVSMPAYDAFPMDKYIDFLKKSGRSIEIYTSRGCPYSCTYCYRISGQKVRHRAIEKVVVEMEHLVNKYGINKFSFEDDCFALNRNWVYPFCAEIKKLGVKFRFQATINTLDDELLDVMQEAGLTGVSFGMESASPLILKEMKKPNSIPKAEAIISSLRKRGLKYNASFILGMPSENDESVEMTKDFLVRMGFDTNFQIFFLAPYPGTVIYNSAMEKGLIKSEIDYISGMQLQDKISLNLTAFPDEKLFEWKERILSGVAKANGKNISEYSGVTWKSESL